MSEEMKILKVGDDVFEIVDEQARNEIEALKRTGYVTPQMYGAKGDGVTDDTDAIQECLDTNRGKTIFFPNGEYAISSPLLHWGAPQASNLIFDNARITAKSAMDYMLLFGHNTSAYQDWEGYGIYGKAIFNCNNLAEVGIRVDNYCFSADIKDVAIMNLPENGIGLQMGTDGSIAAAMVLTVDNLYVWNSQTRPGTVAIEVNGGDSFFNNIETQRTEIGMDFKQGHNNQIENVHLFIDTPVKDQTNSVVCGIRNYTSRNEFSNIYIDNYRWGMRSTQAVVINGYNYYLPASINSEVPSEHVICSAMRSVIGVKCIINGLYMAKKIDFVDLMGVYLSNLTSDFDTGKFDLCQCDITATDTDGFRVYADEAFNIRNNNRVGDIITYGSRGGLSTGNYLIGYIEPLSSYTELDVAISNTWMGTIKFKSTRTATPPITAAPTLTELKKNTGASALSFIISNEPIAFMNHKYYPVYLKVNSDVSYIFMEVKLRTWGGCNFYACHYEDASKMTLVESVTPMYTINFGDGTVV